MCVVCCCFVCYGVVGVCWCGVRCWCVCGD